MAEEVRRLGLVEGKALSANELAAQGVKLSLRDKLKKQILQIDLENAARNQKVESSEPSKIEEVSAAPVESTEVKESVVEIAEEDM